MEAIDLHVLQEQTRATVELELELAKATMQSQSVSELVAELRVQGVYRVAAGTVERQWPYVNHRVAVEEALRLEVEVREQLGAKR